MMELLLASLLQTKTAWAEMPPMESSAQTLISNYQDQKNEVTELEQQTRSIMSTLYDINSRMKGLNRKRGILDNKMLGLEHRVFALNREVKKIEGALAEQKDFLGRRLRAMYTMSDQSLAYILFSSSDRHELDQNIKYLKLISQSDLRVMRSYESNLKKQKSIQATLDREMRKLSRTKTELSKFESALSSDQAEKSLLLQKLGLRKEKKLAQISRLREIAVESKVGDVLNISFYENKGRLAEPTTSKLLRGYGVIENEKFNYKLGHKGFTYDTRPGDLVRSVFDGDVAHVGLVDGYGRSVIVDHGDHYYSVYTNLQNPIVKKGDKIKAMQKIADAGTNFYFELRHFSETINPNTWFKN